MREGLCRESDRGEHDAATNLAVYLSGESDDNDHGLGVDCLRCRH